MPRRTITIDYTGDYPDYDSSSDSYAEVIAQTEGQGSILWAIAQELPRNHCVRYNCACKTMNVSDRHTTIGLVIEIEFDSTTAQFNDRKQAILADFPEGATLNFVINDTKSSVDLTKSFVGDGPFDIREAVIEYIPHVVPAERQAGQRAERQAGQRMIKEAEQLAEGKRDDVGKALCNLDRVEIVPYDNFIQDMSLDGAGEWKYKGNSVDITSTRLAAGTYGAVDLKEFTNDGKVMRFVEKIPLSAGDVIEEARVVTDYVRFRECEDIIPMKLLDGNRIIMPYVSGDMSTFIHRLTVQQADKIVKIVRTTLDCLATKGVYYCDIKLQNILYNCDESGEFTVLLGDMGSILPDEDGEYTATYPHPLSHKSGFIKHEYVSANHKELYDYQMTLMYFSLIGYSGIRFDIPDYLYSSPTLTLLKVIVMLGNMTKIDGIRKLLNEKKLKDGEFGIHHNYVKKTCKIIEDTLSAAKVSVKSLSCPPLNNLQDLERTLDRIKAVPTKVTK